MNKNTKSLATITIGILIGATVTYLGIDKLTDKVFETSISLGELRGQISSMEKMQSDLQLRVTNSQKTVSKLERESLLISDNLLTLKKTDKVELAKKLEAIEKLSKDSQTLVELREEVTKINQNPAKLHCTKGNLVKGLENEWSEFSYCPENYHAVGFGRLNLRGNVKRNTTHVNDIQCTANSCRALCAGGGCDLEVLCCNVVQ